MTETITFQQQLNKVMQKHRLSANDLAMLIGGRTELKHVLAGEATHAKRKKLYDKLKESHLFDEDDYIQLSHSLEVSRLGIDRFRFTQAIDEILSGKVPDNYFELHTEDGGLLKERLSYLDRAGKIEIICFNCCYHSLFFTLAPLFNSKERDISIRHYIQCYNRISTAAEYISSVMPVIFDPRYTSYYKPDSSEENLPSISGNQLLIRAEMNNEQIENYFIIAEDKIAYELPQSNYCHMYTLINKVLQAANPQPVAIKETTPYQLDFPSLCMTFLSYELNRATYDIGWDLCFQQIPTEIALAAFRDKGFSSNEEIDRIISRTLSIHEQRYQNQYKKKKPTYHIMTIDECERFLATGEMNDHFIGFRSFKPEERKVIFQNMIEATNSNANFIPLLLIEKNFHNQYNLVCYEKLGVSIDDKNTDYDISNGYRSVFLMLPDFTKYYQDFYLNHLVSEHCYSKQKSLELLEEMYQQFLKQNGLSK